MTVNKRRVTQVNLQKVDMHPPLESLNRGFAHPANEFALERKSEWSRSKILLNTVSLSSAWESVTSTLPLFLYCFILHLMR